MQDYGTEALEIYAAEVTKKHLETSIFRSITNDDYEGQVTERGSVLKLLSLGDPTVSNYTGADMSDAETIKESVATLTTDQAKALYFGVPSIKQFYSQVKNPESTVLTRGANKIKIGTDSYILGLYGDVAAGNRVGTDYTTGTVTVDVTTGAVTGSGTTFTAAMVGRGFKALGHTKFYRVKSYASATSIVIEDDLDDVASAYTGGAIAGGATYVVEAATAVQITKDTVYKQLTDLGVKLDLANVPSEGRFCVLPPEVYALLQNSSLVAAAVPGVHDEVVKRGYVGMTAGFELYKSNQVSGDSVNGWHILAGVKDWATFAMGFTENGYEDKYKNFGKNYKGLTVYGAKVIDQNRPYAAELFGKL